MAGSDTTVTALRSTLLFIITNPIIYTKVQDELTELYKAADAATTQAVITDVMAQKLTYLGACIRESIRFLPPSYAMLQKLVPPQGDQLPDGRFIPGGTRVGTCVYGILRNRSIFGDDADVYRPERWLEAESAAFSQLEDSYSEKGGDARGKYRRMIQAADIVFGSGRYQCLGKTVAMLELRKTLATVCSPRIHNLRYNHTDKYPNKAFASI